MQQSPLRPSTSQRHSYNQSYPAASPGPHQQIQARPFSSSVTFNNNPSTPSLPRAPQTLAPQPSSIPSNPYAPAPAPTTAASYRGPPPIEAYTLPDIADASIPDEIRYLFQTDEQGKVVFFTAPPVYVQGQDEVVTLKGEKVGHSARYLAAKVRRQEELARRMGEREVEREEARGRKRQREQAEAEEVAAEVERVKRRAVGELVQEVARGAGEVFKGLYGDWEGEAQRTVGMLEAVQTEKNRREEAIVELIREREERDRIVLGRQGLVFDA